jgi:DNA-binding transcriptional LysR family regulator
VDWRRSFDEGTVVACLARRTSSELRVRDLNTFLAVKRSGSVSSAAREQGVTPSQVSKATSRLEAVLRLRLFSRGARGVMLNDQARIVLPYIEAAVTSLQLLEPTVPH